jgi:hypothetical protein
MSEQGSKRPAERGTRTEKDQQEEAQNRGRQNQRQCRGGFDRRQPAAATEHQRRRQRYGDGQQDDGGDRGQLEGEGERLPIHWFRVTGWASERA